MHSHTWVYGGDLYSTHYNTLDPDCPQKGWVLTNAPPEKGHQGAKPKQLWQMGFSWFHKLKLLSAIRLLAPLGTIVRAVSCPSVKILQGSCDSPMTVSKPRSQPGALWVLSTAISLWLHWFLPNPIHSTFHKTKRLETWFLSSSQTQSLFFSVFLDLLLNHSDLCSSKIISSWPGWPAHCYLCFQGWHSVNYRTLWKSPFTASR